MEPPRISRPARVWTGWAVLAALGGVGLMWAHTWAVSVNDFGGEAAPAFSALLHGHLSTFLALAPAYGGSLELRAPLAWVFSVTGASELGIYRASAIPCALAAAGLGVWLVTHVGSSSGRLARVTVLAVCVVNPVTYQALVFGHPEELLGGVLCVAAVLCATRDRPVLAGLLLGLAIGNKEWALVAVGPVLIALPSRRPIAIAVAAAAAAAMLLPILLAAPGGLVGAPGRLATKTGEIFHPFQVWWFLGRRLDWLPAMASTIPKGARITPDWLDGRAHLIVVGISAPLTLAYHRSRRVTRSPLLLLTFLLLLRCVLDPWDIAYYPLPFIVALVSWETVSGAQRAPLRSVAATAAVWSIFVVLPKHVGVDVQSVACMVVAVPVILLLSCSIYRPLRRQASAVEGFGLPSLPAAAAMRRLVGEA